MDFPFRTADVSTFVHATEDEGKVLKALRLLLPEEVEVGMAKLKGHYGNPILALSASIKQRKLLRELWARMVEKLPVGEVDKLERIVPDRIDETCHLYLRFDKQLAYAGEFALTEGGDAIHMALKVAAYPAKWEVAANLVQEFLAGERLKRKS